MSIEDKKKRLLRILLITVLVVFAAENLLWLVSQSNLTYTQEEEAFSISINEFAFSNCELQGDTLIPTGEDPQIMINMDDSNIRSVILVASEPVKELVHAQIFYSGWEIPVSEQNSVQFNIFWGSSVVGVDLPGDEYSYIRIDLDAPIKLQKVIISSGSLTITHCPYYLNIFRMLLCVCVVIFICALYLFVPFVSKPCLWFYDRIMNQETRYRMIDILYAVGVIAVFFHHIYITLMYPVVTTGATQLKDVWIWAAAVSVVLGQMWRKKTFWLLVISLVWLYISPMLAPADGRVESDTFLYTGIYAFFVCFSACYVLRPSMRRKFIMAFSVLWTFAILVLCLFGLYSAITEQPLYTEAGGYFSIEYYRLVLVYYYSISGGIASTGVATAVVAFAIVKQKWLRCLLVIAALLILVTVGLTVTRAAMVTCALSLGLFVFAAVSHRKQSVSEGSLEIKKRVSTGRYIVAFALFAVVTIGTILFQNYVPDMVNYLKSKGFLLITNAMAEEADAIRTVFVRRTNWFGGSLDWILSGRLTVWQTVLDYFKEKPSALLYGKPVNWLFTVIMPSIVHCHSMWFLAAIEGGIPGLLLWIVFTGSVVLKGLKCLFKTHSPMWQCLIFVPFVTILVSETVEVLTRLETCYPTLTVFYFFAGCVSAVYDCQFGKGRNKRVEKL